MTDRFDYARPEIVIAAARQVVENELGDAPLATTLQAVISAFERAAMAYDPPRVPALTRLPLLVHGAVLGDQQGALPLAGIALLLFIGIDLLDDIMDSDITPYWRGANAAETLLVATTLTCALPQAAITSLQAPAGVRASMQGTLARGLLWMARGQLTDIRSTGTTSLAPDDVLSSVSDKSGAFTAMLAELGAILAGASEGTIGAYRDWGQAYGTADQLRSDCADLFRDPIGSDLAGRISGAPRTEEWTSVPSRDCSSRHANAGPPRRCREVQRAPGPTRSGRRQCRHHCAGLSRPRSGHQLPTR